MEALGADPDVNSARSREPVGCVATAKVGINLITVEKDVEKSVAGTSDDLCPVARINRRIGTRP
jgi:hypothetical protein